MTSGTGRLQLGLLLRTGEQSQPAGRVVGWGEIREMSEMAEAVGFDTIWVADHVIFRTAGSVVMEPGSAIVVTASLAGLVGMERDPLYTLTKHGVVGFVRSVAAQLDARGIRISAIAPGFTDTPLLGDASREATTAAGIPLLAAEEVAAAALRAARESEPGAVWVVQPGREPVPFRFPNVPGPR